jgi:hypothetical protein
MEFLGGSILTIKETAVAKVLNALHAVIEVKSASLLNERAWDVKTYIQLQLFCLEWVIKVNGEGIVEEVGVRGRDEWELS